VSRLNVLFPVETINRELDYRLFLAVMLANKANSVFVGQHDVIHEMSKYMRHGVYIGKNVFPNGRDMETGQRHRVLKERGFVVVYLDEEGGSFRGDTEDAWARTLESQMDVTRLEADDYVCAWGEFQKDLYASRNPRCRSNIRTTGHPRFDLYKTRYREYFQRDAQRIRRKHGPFILINTALSLANPGPGIEYAFCRENGWDPGNPSKRIRHIAEYSYLCSVLNSFLSLINRLSLAFPKLNIVVRPHPTEDFDFYGKIFAGVPNVRCVHEGPVAPWLFACEALVQNGCTTGVEAYLAGTKVIVYRNPERPEFEPFLPNTLGLTCRDEESVVEAIKTLIENQAVAQEAASDRAVSLLENLRADSFAAIQTVYQECESRISGNGGQFDMSAFFMKDAIRAMKREVKSRIRPYIPRRLMKNRYSARWIRVFDQMFYGFRESDVRARLGIASAVVRKDVEMRFYSRDLFRIEAR
jgi:surface carbohydrate biosynthesis protein